MKLKYNVAHILITAHLPNAADEVARRAPDKRPLRDIFGGGAKNSYLRYNLLWVKTVDAPKAALGKSAKRYATVPRGQFHRDK